jgi:deoxyribonuclease-4
MVPARPLGAHVSATAANNYGLERIAELGIGCAQVFGTNKMQWKARTYRPEQIARFRRAAAAAAVGPIYSHGIYLANFGSREANPPVWEKSIAATIAGLSICEALGHEGLIVHLGSNYGLGFDGILDSVVDSLGQVLAEHTGSARLILENSAGNTRIIGGRVSELGRVIDGLGGDPRLGVCIDTAHAFAFGYELRDRAGIAELAADIDRAGIGERLQLLHVNDSKVDCGQLRDRHANLGEGFIGIDGITQTVRHPIFAGLPLVLETPGFSGGGPDAANVALLEIAAGCREGDPEEIVGLAREGKFAAPSRAASEQ